MSFLKEVSQKCFVFDLQSFVFEGSLAEMLRFLSFKDSFLKEVSHKSFVFELQSFIFEGRLAEKLCFWASKLHFWRKSRRKASFLSFKASILKEVSQKSFVFDLQSFIFERSLAQKLRFWSSKLYFWRNSRTKASFWGFKASFLKEVSQKWLIFELQSFVFEGSPAEKLRFGAAKLRFWRKPRRNASFLIFKDGAGLATGIQGIYNWNSIFVVNLFSESHRKTDVCVMSIIFQWKPGRFNGRFTTSWIFQKHHHPTDIIDKYSI